jgi:hypothetical protein
MGGKNLFLRNETEKRGNGETGINTTVIPDITPTA